jgi:hypothetical protein
MLHEYVQRFDVTENLKILIKFLASKRCLGLGLESGEPAGWSQSAAREESCGPSGPRVPLDSCTGTAVAGGVACACGPFKSGRLYFSIKNQSAIVFVVVMS